MPWHSTRDPYPVWVGLVLLQQTQVETVRPYFRRFLRAFPTLESLAAASQHDVLKAWEGCGYYARARNLHRAARQLVRYGNGLPRTTGEWRKLPGVGEYTAAAIASIVFGEPVAAVDGNVERVLSRVLCERRIARTAPVRRRIRKAAQSIIDEGARAGISSSVLNQAMMELGAVVCMPRRALCDECPLQSECRACTALDDVTVLPRKAVPRKIPHYDIGTAIIVKRDRLLIAQRMPDDLLGGLWEFPGGKRHEGESLEECVAREIREELGIKIEVGSLFCRVPHAYSHFRVTLHAFLCRHKAGRIRKVGVADFCWVQTDDFPKYAFPKADRVILALLQQHAGPILAKGG